MRVLPKPAKLVGYIIYHGKRFNEWCCPNKKCGMHIAEDYVCCPYCGQKVKFMEVKENE